MPPTTTTTSTTVAPTTTTTSTTVAPTTTTTSTTVAPTTTTTSTTVAPTTTTTETTAPPTPSAPRLAALAGGCDEESCAWTLGFTPVDGANGYALSATPAGGSGVCSAPAGTCVVTFAASQSECYSVQAFGASGDPLGASSNQVCLPS